MFKITFLYLALLITSCTLEDEPSIVQSPVVPDDPLEFAIYSTENADVLLLSDHTYPGHFAISSGGANGEERIYIDPTLVQLQRDLEEVGLSSFILNVEDMLESKVVSTEEEFYAAYADYDSVLTVAVRDAKTILAIHYDANIIEADASGNGGYIGGAQVILDPRNVSDQSRQFAEDLISKYNILESLAATGLRIRPDYDDQIRFQRNLTLRIIGGSEGAGVLLEIGPQEQAIQLFGDKDAIVEAIEKPLKDLAAAIKDFRDQLD